MERLSLRPATLSEGNASGKQGFTFVEMLVTLAILSVLFLAVHGVFSRTLSSKRRADKRFRRAVVADSLLRWIANDLRGAFALTDGTELFFLGTHQSLSFASTVGSPGGAGPDRAAFGTIRYELGHNDESPLFARLFRTEGPGLQEPLSSDARELYPWVTELRFRYLAKAKGLTKVDRMEFFDEWDSRTQAGLPLAVEVQLSVAFPMQFKNRYLADSPEGTEVGTYTMTIAIPTGGELVVEAPKEEGEEEEE